VAAALPPATIVGLDPSWSRLVTAPVDGVQRTWHVLDTWATRLRDGPALRPRRTYVCVHGNPTWSYLWRELAATSDPRDRVVAVDHLGMGYSERTGYGHRFADRIDELGIVTDALAVTGPVVTVGHDWGGSISLGWALAHRDQLAGIVLTNTAVAQPSGAATPTLISLARSRPLRTANTVRTPAFVEGTVRLSGDRITDDDRTALRAPYRGTGRRAAIGDFVADIPLEPEHPSAQALDQVATGITTLDVPVLLLWGPEDPVFGERYLADLLDRLPQADVHRFEGTGHLVVLEAPVADAVRTWAEVRLAGDRPASDAPASAPAAAPASGEPLWAAIARRRNDPAPAVVERGNGGRTVTWPALDAVVNALASGLTAEGIGAGDRVALLVPPGADLTACVYACWRIGAVIVVADAGLGWSGLRRALRSARADAVIGVAKGLAAARAMGIGGRYVLAGRAPAGAVRALRAVPLPDVARSGRGEPLPPAPGPDAEAAVLFTSGATGPAKGVVYRHRQLQSQRDLIASTYGVTDADALVAAFAPFALYGPALGITSCVPEMDVTAPGSLSARALADAVGAIDASLVFASPAALRNVVATADVLSAGEHAVLAQVRLLLSAGAPVPTDTLRAASALLGAADAHTPYGMTEALPVCDISLDELAGAGPGHGVCVGQPLPGVDVALAPLSDDGEPAPNLVTTPDVTGEIVVRAAHVKDRYDQLWLTQYRSAQPIGWHRTGDIGHFDPTGRLWVEGRLAHIVTTADGVVTPVGLEQRIEQVPQVQQAAVVGVGPSGTQQVVAVVVADDANHGAVATLPLLDAVRDVVDVDIAAVLVRDALPVDIRHNSKIDRAALATWADDVLAGHR
jgi:acyl-coenzyme A synthetase/AMP-(fatty) acid ligase/pimeloyl-ACP methyl ester carboxylesterase